MANILKIVVEVEAEVEGEEGEDSELSYFFGGSIMLVMLLILIQFPYKFISYGGGFPLAPLPSTRNPARLTDWFGRIPEHEMKNCTSLFSTVRLLLNIQPVLI